jgi:hypothetical protein
MQRTYVFERVHPDWRIVVAHTAPAVVHLMTRCATTLREVCDDDVGVPRPRRWRVRSGAECDAVLEGLPGGGSSEGLVVRDAHGERIKLKRREYVLLHDCTNGHDRQDFSWVARACTPSMDAERMCLNVWLRDEQQEFAAYFPDLRERYARVARRLDDERAVLCERAGLPPDADVRELTSATSAERRAGRLYAHEERLWHVLQG